MTSKLKIAHRHRCETCMATQTAISIAKSQQQQPRQKRHMQYQTTRTNETCNTTSLHKRKDLTAVTDMLDIENRRHGRTAHAHCGMKLIPRNLDFSYEKRFFTWPTLLSEDKNWWQYKLWLLMSVYVSVYFFVVAAVVVVVVIVDSRFDCRCCSEMLLICIHCI